MYLAILETGITTNARNGARNIDVLIELYSFVGYESIMRFGVLNSEGLYIVFT